MTELETLRLLSCWRQLFTDPTPVEVLSVHDGDTFRVLLPGWPKPVERMLIRMAHIDAPELHDSRPAIAAIAAKAHDRMAELMLLTPVILTSIRPDDYFRLLCTVTAAGQDAGTVMLAEGLARPYEGHGIKPW